MDAPLLSTESKEDLPKDLFLVGLLPKRLSCFRRGTVRVGWTIPFFRPLWASSWLPRWCGGKRSPLLPEEDILSGSVQEEDPSNSLLKAFNLVLEWSSNENQRRDQTVSCYATVFFFLYFNTSGSSEICAVSMQFCGPTNDSNNSQCIQRQQDKLPLIACLLSARTVSQNHFIIMIIILF